MKKRSWKFWTSRTLLVLLVLGGIWITNLIWFKPFSINHFYEKIFIELVINSPEYSTRLDIPFFYNRTKAELDDISDAKLREELDKMTEVYTTLLSYDFEGQSKENQLNTKILASYLKLQSVDYEPFFYHDYPVNQLEGEQKSLPNLLVNHHKLEVESDIDAYISRLTKFESKFDQLIENLKIRESKGITAPKFINTIILQELNEFIGTNEEDAGSSKPREVIQNNVLFTNFSTKVDRIEGLTAEDKQEAKEKVHTAIEKSVFPSYRKLISAIEQQNKTATDEAGVWKFPNGNAYYQYSLKMHTTTDLKPNEIHQLGLAEVARIKEDMQRILVTEGLADSTKSVGEIIQGLSRDKRFLYPNNQEGRKSALSDYKSILEEIEQRLDTVFDLKPQAPLEVKAVPKFKEAGSPFAYYEGPSLKGSGKGVFYTNLRDMNEIAKFGMKTIAYHEGIPGHHFQIAIQRELQGLPTFRTIIPFTAYLEGWALYTEQLAWELGLYKDDPFGNLGRLQAEMLRSVRLVVDSGIHYKKWTRQEAIDYMVENTGMGVTEVITEVDRYVVMPGQACAYKVGMLKILELREKAKEELGAQFKLSDFHNVILKNGAVPLDVLEEIVEDYIAEKQMS